MPGLLVLLNIEVFGNTVFSLFQAFDIFLALLIIQLLAHRITKRKLEQYSNYTITKLDDLGCVVINQLNWPLFSIISLSIARFALNIPIWLIQLINLSAILTISIYFVIIIREITNFWIENLTKKKQNKVDSQQKSIMYLTSLILQLTVWIIAVLLVLQNYKVDITALVGTLGIGGIAIAFAMQSILSDIFASFSIYFDQPFGVGDFIQVGTDAGTVEKIGIKSTRIKTIQGEMMVIPNKELTGIRIQNFSHLERRRVKFKFKVDIKTSNTKLKALTKNVRRIVEEQDHCELDRCNLIELSDLGLIYEVVYFVDSSDYNTYLNIQEKINLELKEYLEKEQIPLGIPTQKINLIQ